MTSQELYDYAVSLLAKRDYASGELTRVLGNLTEDREDIDRALSHLVECGYLDDHRLITDYRLSQLFYTQGSCHLIRRRWFIFVSDIAHLLSAYKYAYHDIQGSEMARQDLTQHFGKPWTLSVI
ncbi:MULTISPECIES: regulatory protein RecX [Yersinia]|uniref:Recombination regulator RecX n=1 Tax=Yersinia pekkanenii TaxID=1288385 RepID=A0A0T9RGG9_9GAMM|nr:MULTISPECIES: hypothetical protein [Yersinia]CNI61462.1 recombination regulator RecX [Yersinia pekkanenii]CRY69259.1 recombination regulator RecX [Yersinia pekkanenii]